MPSPPIRIRLFSYGEGERRTWENAAEKDHRLRMELETRGIGEVHVLLDATVFNDPAAVARGLNEHTGRNPYIIHALVHSAAFPHWIRGAKQKILACSNVNPLNIVVSCRSGKHRSVAAGIVLRHVLMMEGHILHARIEPPIDLLCATWGRHCCHGVCPECLSMPDFREEALIYAHHQWESSQLVRSAPSAEVPPEVAQR